MTIELSRVSRILAGALLLSLVTVETGGLYLVQLVGYGGEATDFQLGFARAGHAHAGVLLILSLVSLVYADAARLSGISGILGRFCVPIAALLMPAGFFFSSIHQDATEPNGLIVLIWIGGISLAVGLITLGVNVLRSGLAHSGASTRTEVPANSP